jgi:hypothetical protein
MKNLSHLSEVSFYMKWLVLTISVCILSTPICAANTVYDVRAWEVSIDSAVKDYCSGSECTPINVISLKDYDNRIFNHIITVNSEIRARMQLLRSDKKPVRDLLFIDRKLYEIMERQDSVDDFTFRTVFVNLKNSYGLPEMKKEKDLTIYTFKNEKTNAILIVHPFGNVSDIRIYLYSQSLFRTLFSD